MSDIKVALKKLYAERWDADKYMEEYVAPGNDWQRFLVKNLHQVVETGAVKGERGLDLGCGPSVHRLAILGRACDELTAMDYSESSLNYVKRWMKEGEPQGPVGQCLETVSRLEGFQNVASGQKALRDRILSKVKNVVQCDVTSPESMKNLLNYGGLFDFAHSLGCLDSACMTIDSYESSLKLINSILKPKAALVLSGFIGGTYYVVNNVIFPALFYNEDIIKASLEKTGFKLEQMQVCDFLGIPTEKCNQKKTFFSVSYKL